MFHGYSGRDVCGSKSPVTAPEVAGGTSGLRLHRSPAREVEKKLSSFGVQIKQLDSLDTAVLSGEVSQLLIGLWGGLVSCPCSTSSTPLSCAGPLAHKSGVTHPVLLRHRVRPKRISGKMSALSEIRFPASADLSV